VVKLGTKLSAKTKNGKKQHKVDQYVELARQKTDKIFVVLAEFGNDRDPSYPDQDTDPATPGPARFDGPLHNQIPQPGANDNSTIWQPDFNRQHFQDLYFSTDPAKDSLANFYSRASSGRYSVEGTVTDWVKVKYNEARYGRSNGFPCGGTICSNAYDLVRDGVNAWYDSQRAAGRTTDQIKADLAQFDQWDRYDYDGDGNFNEPDGYIDHFQIVHAGGDQADGDPVYGEDAIWSHRSYAYQNNTTGPDGNLAGGTQIGDTGMWVGDYTMQPENGGISVFAHEYGHDLGLPDLYDTAGGDNGINWWSLMAQNRVSAPGEAVGFRADDFDAWSKLQLGWLDYKLYKAGDKAKLDLGPHEYNSAKPQAVVVQLPDKSKTFKYGDPFAGAQQWWSTKGDNLDTSMARPIDLTGKTSAAVSLKARYDIEQDFDYLYAQASDDDGAHWTTLDGTVNGQPFQHDSGNAPALTGSTNGAWADMNVPLDGFAGKNILFRFRYVTDGGVALNGFFADEINVTADGQTVFSDGAENGDNGWTLDAFRTTTGTETQSFPGYYIASNRTYQPNDKYMETGPYNFGFPDKPDFVEHFPYQTGLLVSYWDTSEPDNNTSEHPGEGLVLPIDAHPAPISAVTGALWRPRIAAYDAPFSLKKADSITLHVNGTASPIKGLAAQPLFDDTGKYWFAEQPTQGPILPATGTTIKVLSQSGTSMTIKIDSKQK
jgi:immune inhibitor A